MKRFIPLCLLALPVAAEETPREIVGLSPTGVGQDSVSITQESAIMGVLEYFNSGDLASWPGAWRVVDGNIDCTISIELGGEEVNFAEIATVHCLNGFVADPPVQTVPDGERFMFFIGKAVG